jgi:hypothetical protein
VVYGIIDTQLTFVRHIRRDIVFHEQVESNITKVEVAFNAVEGRAGEHRAHSAVLVRRGSMRRARWFIDILIGLNGK